MRSRLPVSIEVVSPVEDQLEGQRPVLIVAEVVKPALELLALLPVGMGRQREVGIGLRRFATDRDTRTPTGGPI